MTARSFFGATLALATFALAAPGVAYAAPLAPANSWVAVAEQYETIRLALVADKLDGVGVAAASIRSTVATLAKSRVPSAAGVPAASLAAVQALLPEIEAAAAALSAAPNLDAARDAFYELSRPLVHWRDAAGTGPAVAFCPMAKRSWLQPKGDIGNPYYGRSMATCGEIVNS